MTKQNLIKQAYGDSFNEDLIDENGWSTYIHNRNLSPVPEPFGMYETNFHTIDSYKWRPIALKGIENNNFWTLIRSDADLPKEAGKYVFLKSINSNIEITYNFNPNLRIDVIFGEMQKFWRKYEEFKKPLFNE